MSCDAYIINRKKPVRIRMMCYECGREVNPNNPRDGHEGCWYKTMNEHEDSLGIYWEWENITEL